MQMNAQQQLIQQAKEAAEEQAKATKTTTTTDGDKVNVLDIKVEDDFDIDDI